MKNSALAAGMVMLASAQQLIEITDANVSATPFEKIKNRFGNWETTVKHDLEKMLFEKHISLGGDSHHFYLDYQQ